MADWVRKIQGDKDLGNIAKTLGIIIAEKYSDPSVLTAKFNFYDLAHELDTSPDIIRVGIYQLLSAGFLKQLAGAAGRPAYSMHFPKPETVDCDEEVA